ncbi:MAG: 50S ribosomal protein L33 [Bacilli bacterium]
MRKKIILICTVCLARNYQTLSKGSGVADKRLQLKKYCPHCNQSTLHQESK